MTVGDFNGDGLPDLLVASGSTVDVLINQGNGQFGKAASMQTPGSTFIQQIGAGDLNGDAAIDLVVFWGDGPWEGWINTCGPGAAASLGAGGTP